MTKDFHHIDPLEVIGAIRTSFADSTHVYTQGSCFELYRILKTIWPDAEPWTNIDHVWTKIGDKVYDIYGLRTNGTEGLTNMLEDERMLLRAHQWAWRSSWRLNAQM